MEKSRFCLWTCSSVSSFSGNFFRISCLSGEKFWSGFPSRAKKNGCRVHLFRLPAVIKLAVPGEQIRKIRDFFGGEERIFSGFSFRSLKKMSLIADKLYRVSVVSSRRERFINLFFSVRSRNSFMCACFFLFVCTCARMCAYTRPREIHNVGLFPSVFESIKKRLPATVLFTAIYKNSSKFPQKSIA